MTRAIRTGRALAWAAAVLVPLALAGCAEGGLAGGLRSAGVGGKLEPLFLHDDDVPPDGLHGGTQGRLLCSGADRLRARVASPLPMMQSTYRGETAVKSGGIVQPGCLLENLQEAEYLSANG